ncbi:MAG: DUF1186 domain-containing protein, partial [Bacteroidales bacterium]|nr:DUF1186 domain-containing protein [Bacteroidales bacterium]
LKRKIKHYPRLPQLKNFLSVAWMKTGNEEKSYEVNDWILKEHPGYLFGLVNKANEHYIKGEYDKMPELLGQAMELKLLYPNREVFHSAEVIYFYFTAIMYLTAVGDTDAAKVRLNMLQDIAPDHEKTRQAEALITQANLEAAREQMAKEEEERITPEFSSYDQSVQTNQPPKFTHQLIHELYKADYHIDRKVVANILALPRESLIDDLRKVLRDAIQRYEYFNRLADEGEIEDEKMFFPIHTVLLLGELKAGEAIRDILETLRQGEAFITFWYGAFLTEILWQPLYKLIDHNLEVFRDFMLEPGVDTFAKSVVSSAVLQYYLHNPDSTEQIRGWYQSVLTDFLTTEKENLIDTDLISLIICDVMEGGFRDLLLVIDKLFEAGYVAESICGTREDVHKDFGNEKIASWKKGVLSIYDQYDDIVNNWYDQDEDMMEEGPGSELLTEETPNDGPVIREPKVGRNDPCPCGSGKKYKKCCLVRSTD